MIAFYCRACFIHILFSFCMYSSGVDEIKNVNQSLKKWCHVSYMIYRYDNKSHWSVTFIAVYLYMLSINHRAVDNVLTISQKYHLQQTLIPLIHSIKCGFEITQIVITTLKQCYYVRWIHKVIYHCTFRIDCYTPKIQKMSLFGFTRGYQITFKSCVPN